MCRHANDLKNRIFSSGFVATRLYKVFVAVLSFVMQVIQILSSMNALLHFPEISCIMTQEISGEVLLDVFLAVVQCWTSCVFWNKSHIRQALVVD